jgi:hypothetical protein
MVCKGDVNVVCLKWGVKYPADYVNRLHRMVKRSLARPHRFVCLTDDPSDLDPAIETKPIENPELSGWWHKLTLFKPKFFDLEGPTLFLDLDLVIIDGLDNFFLYSGEFCVIRDWRPQEHNSSVFRIVLGTHPEVWEQFARNHESISGRLHGDQDWLREMLPDALGWPKGWVKSYKWHLQSRDGEGPVPLPVDTFIVAFHGRPRPHEVKDGSWGPWKQAPWIADYWK